MSTLKPHNSGQWTVARYNGFIKSALRKARWPVKYESMKRSQVGKKINEETGRLAMHHECAHCKGHFPSKQMAEDHIDPVVDPAVGFVDWNTYIERLFVELDNFQSLCKECHTKKTNTEKEIAKRRRNV